MTDIIDMSEHDTECELMGDHDAIYSTCCCKERQEIERLRQKSEKDNKLLYAETEKVYLAEKDNERLRKDVVHWREAHRSCIEAGDILKEEIQRLRNQLCNLDYY